MEAPQTVPCAKCKRHQPVSDFSLIVRGAGKGSVSKICVNCVEQRHNLRNQKKADSIHTLSLSDFLSALQGCSQGTSQAVEFEAHVCTTNLELLPQDIIGTPSKKRNAAKLRADSLAAKISEHMGYRFTYASLFDYTLSIVLTIKCFTIIRAHDNRESTDHTASIHRYHCAQSRTTERSSKKVTDKSKQRDKLAMDHFDCKGALTITVPKGQFSEVDVSIEHHEDHVPYCNVSLPSEVKVTISDSLNRNPTQVRTQSFNLTRCIHCNLWHR